MSKNIFNELFIDLSNLSNFTKEGNNNINNKYFNMSYEYKILESWHNGNRNINHIFDNFNIYINIKVNNLIIKRVPDCCIINLYCNNNVLKSIDLTKYDNIKLHDYNNVEIINDKIRKEKEKIKENEKKENITNELLNKSNNFNYILSQQLKDFKLLKDNINDLIKYYYELKDKCNKLNY